MPIVRHADQVEAAARQLHTNVTSARVKCVFDQLFDNRRRTLHHLARRDFSGHLRGQLVNASGGVIQAGRRLVRHLYIQPISHLAVSFIFSGVHMGSNVKLTVQDSTLGTWVTSSYTCCITSPATGQPIAVSVMVTSTVPPSICKV